MIGALLGLVALTIVCTFFATADANADADAHLNCCAGGEVSDQSAGLDGRWRD